MIFNTLFYSCAIFGFLYQRNTTQYSKDAGNKNLKKYKYTIEKITDPENKLVKGRFVFNGDVNYCLLDIVSKPEIKNFSENPLVPVPKNNQIKEKTSIGVDDKKETKSLENIKPAYDINHKDVLKYIFDSESEKNFFTEGIIRVNGCRVEFYSVFSEEAKNLLKSVNYNKENNIYPLVFLNDELIGNLTDFEKYLKK